jgi:23S rRNA (pseudouridine1915-N3)-methyltransferase
MRIQLIAMGKKMPTFIQTGFLDYQKRLPKDFSLELIEIPLQKRYSKKGSLAATIEQEGRVMLKAIPKDDFVIALDVRGQNFSTEAFAQQLTTWQQRGYNLSFLIGGPEGLSKICLQRANLNWSLSTLTFPHTLVRLIFAEQLYRAWSILHHHPYHRA